MTGIVLWADNNATAKTPIQLDYSYFSYSQVVSGKGKYDWQPLESLLDAVAGRGHQVVLRWHDTYVGKPTGIPAWIKKVSGSSLKQI